MNSTKQRFGYASNDVFDIVFGKSREKPKVIQLVIKDVTDHLTDFTDSLNRHACL